MKKLQFFGFLAIMLTFGLIFFGYSLGGGSSTVAAQTSGPGQASSASAAVNEAPDSDFTVTLTSDNAGVVIVRYRGSASVVRIPANIQGLPVRIIGEGAFDGRYSNQSHVTSVIIPEGVTEIHRNAFNNCRNLNSVTLPSTLTVLGGNAFDTCISLQSINLPANLREMGGAIFINSGLTSFPNPWPAAFTSIPGFMFQESNLQGDLIIPEGITEIGYRRGDFSSVQIFNRTQITSLTLPSSIREIGSRAFGSTPTLITVNIPESVGSISFPNQDAFEGSRNINLASQARLRALGYTGSF